MKTLRTRSLILSFTIALITMASACIYSIFEHTYLAAATTPIEVKGFAPAGWVGPNQTLCLMARNQTPAGTGEVYWPLTWTTTAASAVHKGKDGVAGSDWYGYSFEPVVLPAWAWTGNIAQVFVSKTCSSSALGILDFSGRVFANQAELDCFSNRLEQGASWNDDYCGSYRNILYIHKP
jgi:hypothetical protein